MAEESGIYVDVHMPWGALSEPRWVWCPEKVFWGGRVGFSAKVGKYMQYMQIHIQEHESEYLHTHTHMYICQKQSKGLLQT